MRNLKLIEDTQHQSSKSAQDVSKSTALTALTRFGLTRAGLEFVRNAILGGPSRQVGGTGFLNVSTHYPSKRMGETRQTESCTAERLFTLDLEYNLNGNVIWYGDQVPQVIIEGHRADGKRYRRSYKADTLVIHRSKPIVYQIKKVEELERLVKERPTDWQLVGNEYQFKPGMEAFARYRILHKVISSASLSQIRAENIQLLMQARDASCTTRLIRLTKKALSVLKRETVMPMSDLLKAIGLEDTTPILKLIDQRKIVTNLSEHRLSMASSAWLALTNKALNSIQRATRQLTPVLLRQGLTSEVVPRSKDLLRIMDRSDSLEGKGSKPRSARTLRRYRKALRDKGGDPLALASKYSNCGLRGSQLDPAHNRLVDRLIKKYYESGIERSLSNLYAIYVGCFKRLKKRRSPGIDGSPIVLETLRSRILGKNQADLADKRGGRRARSAAEPPTDSALRGLPPSRPFQLAHLDHYKADQFVIVIVNKSKVYTVRPWVSFLIDGYTKEILGITVSLTNPSRKSCARVMRDCLRRHARLPEGIITDSGAEFRSNFYHSLLAFAVIEKFERPVRAGRWGNEVERTFGIYKSKFLGQRWGNTKGLKSSRARSRNFHPSRHTNETLIDFYRNLEKFLEWFNAHPHGNSTIAPSVLAKQGLRQYSCSGIQIAYDEKFLIATSISAPRSKYTVDPARGIRTQGRHYSVTALMGYSKRHVEDVRCDPEDDSIVYVHIKNRWRVAENRASTRRLGINFPEIICATVALQDGKAARKAAFLDKEAELGQLTLASVKAMLTPVRTKTNITETERPVLLAKRKSNAYRRTRRHSKRMQLAFVKGS